MIYLSCIDSAPNPWQNLKDVLGVIGDIQTLCSIFSAVILFVLFWISVTSFTKRVNTESINQVVVFKNNRKYIPELFIELNDNLESIYCPGLYVCGEMVDVDGKCGGYNLQWAWTSGYIAGIHAGKQ